MGSRPSYVVALVFPAIVAAVPLQAQPRQSLADPVARPSAASVPGVLISPDHNKLLLMERTAPSAESGAARTFSALVVQPIGRGETRRLILPWRARVKSVFWAPDGDHVGFTIVEEHGVSLWVGDPYSGVIRMLAGPVISAKGEPCQWFHDGESLLCTRMPGDPPEGVVAAGSLRPAGASQLVVYPVEGSERALGRPAVHGDLATSPDGNYLIVETDEGGSSRTEVWDAKTGSVIRVIQAKGSREGRASATDAVASGPRSIEWRGDKPATLVWAEAQDGGNPATPGKVRDRLFQLASPFTSAPAPFADLEFRSRGIVWGGEDMAVVTEGWNKPERSRSWIVRPDGGGPPRLLQGPAGRVAATGTFLTRRKGDGGQVLVTGRQGRVAYLLGAGAAPGGRLSSLDEIDLATGRTQRLWKSLAPFREEIVGVIDADDGRIIIRRESDAQAQNYFLRDFRKNKSSALTNFR